jgi:CRP-like cAMP-binding protein
MLHRLLKTGRALRDAASRPSPLDRIQRVEQSPTAEQAAALLTAPEALMQLTRNEARVVVSYMTPRRLAAGTTFIHEGDARANDFMLLVLAGEISVDTVVVSRTEPLTLTVLGPGSVVGEMGLVDGEARSASCTAITDVQGAVLTRAALRRLTRDDPLTAAKLLMALAQRMAVRLRESADKLKMYAQLTQAMQQELLLGAPVVPPNRGRRVRPTPPPT